jgi:hypothetical protein
MSLGRKFAPAAAVAPLPRASRRTGRSSTGKYGPGFFPAISTAFLNAASAWRSPFAICNVPRLPRRPGRSGSASMARWATSIASSRLRKPASALPRRTRAATFFGSLRSTARARVLASCHRREQQQVPGFQCSSRSSSMRSAARTYSGSALTMSFVWACLREVRDAGRRNDLDGRRYSMMAS